MITIIPAIDIMNGKCVRLSQGDFAQKKVYDVSPLEVAKMYEAIGVTRLHIVDLDGAKSGSIKNLDVLNTIASSTSLTIDYGGGIRTYSDVEAVLNAGAAMINVSSIAVKQPDVFEEWIAQYGADKILLGADVKDNLVAIHGWKDETAISLFPFIKENIDRGIHNFFCTDIQFDGMLSGPPVQLFRSIKQKFPGINFTASGGVAGMADVRQLDTIGCDGVIIGKALYEGRITLNELEDYIANGTY